MSQAPSVSIVIPTRNGQDVVGSSLAELKAANLPAGSQIIVIENGSRDATMQVLDEIQKSWDSAVPLIVRNSAPGLGHAFNLALRLCNADTVYLTADDLPFGLEDLRCGLEIVNSHTVVIGSKAHRQSIVDRPRARKFMSSVFGCLRRAILASRIGDSQGTFVIDTAWAKDVNLHMKESGFLWTTELVDLAEAVGLDIVEIPVVYRPKKSSTTSRIRFLDVLDMLVGLFRIRFRRRYSDLSACSVDQDQTR